MAYPPHGPPMHPMGAPGQPSPDLGSIRSSAIILIVVGFLCGGTLPAIFGIIALVQMDNDPRSAQQMNKIGWIVFWIILGLGILAALAYLAFSALLLGALTLPVIFGG